MFPLLPYARSEADSLIALQAAALEDLSVCEYRKLCAIRSQNHDNEVPADAPEVDRDCDKLGAVKVSKASDMIT